MTETAHQLRSWAITWLRSQWADAVIIPELSVASWGGARIDVAAVTPTELIGVEIKGDGDSTARLALQGMQYGAVCSRLFLLPSANLREKCVNAKPPGWLMATNDKGEWWQKPDGTGAGTSRGHGYDGKSLPTSASRLVEMLWSAEIKTLVDFHGVHIPGGQKMSGDSRGRYVAEELPLKLLRPTVYWLLHRRRWEQARMPKQVWRPEDVLAAG